MRTATVITWDWKEQFDIEDMNEALQKFTDKTEIPYIFRIDTGSDQYGIVVGPEHWSQDRAQSFYDNGN
jgi:DNA relaxase NicK